MNDLWKKTVVSLAAVFCFITCQSQPENRSFQPTQVGSEVAWFSNRLSGSNYAILTNTSSQHLFSLVDSLISYQKLNTIFSPEHGFQVNQADGVLIQAKEAYRQIPVISLYGTKKSPDQTDWASIDTLLIDIQDVGLRYYTYLVTVGLAVESATKAGIPVLVLDRPNPLNGVNLSGPIRSDSLKSMVSFFPVPIQHGLTIGEFFMMGKQEGWWENSDQTQLSVIRMNYWKRHQLWPEIGRQWIAPSPNLPTFRSLWFYQGVCLIEGTNISEGRGTDSPFEWIGAPWFDRLNLLEWEQFGIRPEPKTTTPTAIEGKAVSPKFEGEAISGWNLKLLRDYADSDPLSWTVSFIQYQLQTYPDIVKTRKHLFLLWGKSDLTWTEKDQKNLEVFDEKRKPYLLYD